MALGIIGVIGSILTLAIGIWQWIRRMKRNRRKMAEEGKAKVEKANSDTGSASDLLDGLSKLH